MKTLFRACTCFAAAVLSLAHSADAAAQASAVSAGDVKELEIPSAQYPGGRRVWLYTPAGYPDVCGKECNVLVAFDGGMYLGAMALPHVLDSLIAAKRTRPTVAVLVDNGAPPERIADLANSQRFATFVADELMPWLRKSRLVTHEPARTIITGSSAGALAATYIAFKRPDVFGAVLSQSGAFWRGNEASNDPPYEWLTKQYETAPKKDIRVFLDVGALETVGALGGAAPSLLDANRRLRDVLTAKGYALDYYEVPAGTHSPETWRRRLPIGIATLAPMR